MKVEAVAAGSWRSELYKKSYPRIQILTVADLFNGKPVQMPPARTGAFAKAPRERARGEQPGLAPGAAPAKTRKVTKQSPRSHRAAAAANGRPRAPLKQPALDL